MSSARKTIIVSIRLAEGLPIRMALLASGLLGVLCGTQPVIAQNRAGVSSRGAGNGPSTRLSDGGASGFDGGASLPERGCRTGATFVPEATYGMGGRFMVALRAYCIDDTEVTVNRYSACVNAGVCSTNAESAFGVSNPEVETALCNWSRRAEQDGGRSRADHPINCVDWASAAAFCAFDGGRLPTEAEWEYAAGGGRGQRFPWGNEPPTVRHLNAADDNWVTFAQTYHVRATTLVSGSDGFAGTAPVGSTPSGDSPLGLHDMAGNLSEWVSDWFAQLPTGYVFNYSGPQTGTHRVVRGGSFNSSDADAVSIIGRSVSDPSKRGATRGFRCVYPPIDTPVDPVTSGESTPAVTSRESPSALDAGLAVPLLRQTTTPDRVGQQLIANGHNCADARSRARELAIPARRAFRSLALRMAADASQANDRALSSVVAGMREILRNVRGGATTVNGETWEPAGYSSVMEPAQDYSEVAQNLRSAQIGGHAIAAVLEADSACEGSLSTSYSCQTATRQLNRIASALPAGDWEPGDVLSDALQSVQETGESLREQSFANVPGRELMRNQTRAAVTDLEERYGRLLRLWNQLDAVRSMLEGLDSIRPEPLHRVEAECGSAFAIVYNRYSAALRACGTAREGVEFRMYLDTPDCVPGSPGCVAFESRVAEPPRQTLMVDPAPSGSRNGGRPVRRPHRRHR